jgi:hypothetical protein
MTNSAAPHFRIAWRAFKAHPGLFVASILVLFASWAALEVAVITLHRLGVVFNVLVHLAFLVFFSGITAGLMVITLEVLAGQAPRLATLFGSLDRGPQLLLAFFLYALGVAFGLILLVAPGIYFGVRCAFFAHVLATTKASAMQSLHKAASLSQGRWKPIFVLLLKVFLLNLLGAAILGVGLLITAPVSLLATANFYCTLEPPSSPPT